MDAVKAIACLLIVLHHLAVYGPMSDVAYPLISGLLDGLYQYGRVAVQVFLVIAGFLSAKNLAPYGVPHLTDPLGAIKQRYDRLILPYLAAITLAILCAALARHWMDRDYIPATPDFLQLIAHALLLQDLLNQEALSAGVWYIAIDFQLFALIAALLWMARKIEWRYANATAPLLIAGMTVASLFMFNRNDFWDETAFYFFGAYGMGALSYWAATRPRGWLWLLALGALVGVALLVEFRLRIAVAGVTMLLLGFARRYAAREQRPALLPITYLGRVSYSIFLVHFPLCMVVNATFSHFFPQQPLINALGMVVALGVSIGGGILFFRWVESRATCNKTRLPVLAGFMASGLYSAM
ncbi:MAG: acyltransferase [Sulfuricella sp.]|nr:acyltransferase [Sulfuricella sp.]